MDRGRSILNKSQGGPMRFIRFLRRAIIAFLLMGSVGLNVATLTSLTVFSALSGVVETALDTLSVREKNAQKLAKAESRAVTAETRIERMAPELEATKAKVAKLERELADTRVTYRGAQRPAREAVADASQKIQSRIARAASRNIASMPAEALPFIGVAVIAGATAWEISDACALSEELYELDLAFNPDHRIEEREVCGIQVPTAGELWQTVLESPGSAWDNARELYSNLPDADFSQFYQWLLDQGRWVLEKIGLNAEVAE